MAKSQKFRYMSNRDLESAIPESSNAEELLEFVTSYDCADGQEYCKSVTVGQDLLSKPDPDDPGKEWRLPPETSVAEYKRKLNTIQDRWLELKKRAIDRIAQLRPPVSLFALPLSPILSIHLDSLSLDLELHWPRFSWGWGANIEGLLK